MSLVGSTGAGRASMAARWLVGLVAVVGMGACASVPQGVQQRTVDVATHQGSPLACHDADPAHMVSVAAEQTGALDPDGFSLLNWNVQKGQRDGWLEAFTRFIDGQDLITLQEAWLGEEFVALLASRGLGWDLATTFRTGDRETGVMTVSRTRPVSVCAQRTREPWLLLPKSQLISRFDLRESPRSLLLANIHSVNFTVGSGAFQSQIQSLTQTLRTHDGPLIVAGDFNSWSGKRLEIIHNLLLAPLSLTPVPFPGQTVKSLFGHRIDHIYYRGLDVVASRVEATTASDHNPMWTTFSLQQE